MADLKISDLTAATSATGAMQLEVNDSGATKRITVDQIKSYILVAGFVTETYLGTDAVTTVKIQNLAVTTAKINDLAVTTGKLADNAVSTIKIADAAVTVAKLSAGAPSWDSSGNLTISGNVVLSSGKRIQGDFSNATTSQRTAIQSGTANTNTNFGIIPNGTATNTSLDLYNNSAPDNASRLRVFLSDTIASIISSNTGTGTNLPLNFLVGGSERIRITINGGVSFGNSGTNYGSSGQVLTSNGDAPPTWSSPSGGFTNMVVLETAGSSTWTIPAGVTDCKITVVGGGGGGGGRSSDSTIYYGTGGGAGGIAQKYYTGLTPGNTLSYTVGSAGTAGNTKASGGTGGTSSVSSGTQTIASISATGGAGGASNTFAGTFGGLGGVGSGGTLNIYGNAGGSSSSAGNTQSGGFNMFSSGASVGGNSVRIGNGYGAGGAGGYGASAGTSPTAGTSGVIIIEY